MLRIEHLRGKSAASATVATRDRARRRPNAVAREVHRLPAIRSNRRLQQPAEETEAIMNHTIKGAAAMLMALAATLALAQQPVDASAQARPKSNAHILSNPEFDQLLAHPEHLVIIDVRRPDEVSSVGGFPVYLSIQLKELENSTAWIPKDRTIVVVSNHAGRAARGADILTAKGFKVAGATGAQTYEKAGGSISHIAIPPQAQNQQKPAGAQ
jgi:rhodanese-related sulfurtransferase